MTRSGSFPDRVRVSHTNHRDFRSCAGEQRQEDPHFCARAARRRCAVAGAALYGAGRALAGSGLHGQLGARRAGGGSAPQKLGSTAACGFCKPVRFRKASPRKSRPGARRDRVRWPLDSTTAMQEQSIWGCSPTLFQVAVAPGGHAARASARRCPPLDARATAPSGVLCSSQKLTPCCPLPELPGAARRRSGARPKAAPRPQWRSSTSGAGSRRTSTC